MVYFFLIIIPCLYTSKVYPSYRCLCIKKSEVDRAHLGLLLLLLLFWSSVHSRKYDEAVIWHLFLETTEGSLYCHWMHYTVILFLMTSTVVFFLMLLTGLNVAHVVGSGVSEMGEECVVVVVVRMLLQGSLHSFLYGPLFQPHLEAMDQILCVYPSCFVMSFPVSRRNSTTSTSLNSILCKFFLLWRSRSSRRRKM